MYARTDLVKFMSNDQIKAVSDNEPVIVEDMPVIYHFISIFFVNSELENFEWFGLLS